MSKTEKKASAKAENNDALNNELKTQLDELKKELEILKKTKKDFSEEEKAAIEAAREEMITDDEIGPCYIDPKYVEEGYKYRITDTTRPGKLQKMLRAGYEIVYSDEMKVGDNSVTNTGSLTGAVLVNLGGTDNNRQGVVMRIPTEKYQARQKAKAKKIAEDNAALYDNMARSSDFGEITIGNDTYKK